MACIACKSLLTQETTSFDPIHKCLNCDVQWRVKQFAECKNCGNGHLGKVRLSKDGKAGWMECRDCGCLAHGDEIRWKVHIEEIVKG